MTGAGWINRLDRVCPGPWCVDRRVETYVWRSFRSCTSEWLYGQQSLWKDGPPRLFRQALSWNIKFLTVHHAVWLILLSWEFSWGWLGVLRLVYIPRGNKYCFRAADIKEEPLSLCIYWKWPTEQIVLKDFDDVGVDWSRQANANWNLEYSSTKTSTWRFVHFTGPFKSIESLIQASLVFISGISSHLLIKEGCVPRRRGNNDKFHGHRKLKTEDFLCARNGVADQHPDYQIIGACQ